MVESGLFRETHGRDHRARRGPAGLFRERLQAPRALGGRPRVLARRRVPRQRPCRAVRRPRLGRDHPQHARPDRWLEPAHGRRPRDRSRQGGHPDHAGARGADGAVRGGAPRARVDARRADGVPCRGGGNLATARHRLARDRPATLHAPRRDRLHPQEALRDHARLPAAPGIPGARDDEADLRHPGEPRLRQRGRRRRQAAHGDDWKPANGLTFRKFIKKGFEGLRPSPSDWELHLSTLFPEVRLKRYIEIRGADSGEPASCLSLAALLKGILYDGASRRAAWELVRHLSFKERERLLEEVCRLGPAARVPAPPGAGHGDAPAKGTVPVRDILIEVVRLARQGLNNQGCPEESDYLALLDRRLGGEGGCPAARLAADWEGPMSRNPLKLVEALSQTQVEVA